MNMNRTDYLPDRDVITYIQTVNKNNTRSNNQSEKTYGILQGVINGTRIKKYKTSSTGKLNDGRETNTKINQKNVT